MSVNPSEQQYISLQQLDRVRQPIARASGMPNAAYVDPSLFEYERDQVMGKTWAGLAFAADLPDRSYAQPVDFMGLPLVLLRDKDGAIRVFHNVCSHRGMVLVQEEGDVETMIRCGYHSWVYEMNGQLRGTPHIGGVGKHSTEGFDCARHGLREVRSHIWMGVVFINLSGDAPEFDQHIAPLADRWQNFLGQDGMDLLRTAHNGSVMTLEVECNWKLAVENYCESYHLPWVHPSLNTYSRLEDHYNVVLGDLCSGQGSLAYNLSDTAGTQLPQFPNWPQDKLRTAEYISLYPNVLLGIQADHAFAIVLEPVEQGRTAEHLRLFYVGDEAASEEYGDSRTATLEAWREVFGEDVFAVEGMQKGRLSPGFQGGVFSPAMDEATHHFHTWVANKMADNASLTE